jgi:hypothetical protein
VWAADLSEKRFEPSGSSATDVTLTKKEPMKQEFEYRFRIKLDSKTNLTHVGLEIPLSEGVRPFRQTDLDRYGRDCSTALRAVATQQGLEIIVWVVDIDESCTFISHQVTVRGVLFGARPLHIVRALRPSSAYRTLAFLARAVRNDWRAQSALRAAVEKQKLCRFDSHGERLEEPLPSQLLMRVITETNWGSLISPSDKPWAYVSAATKHIYERKYRANQDPNVDASMDDGDLGCDDNSRDRGDELYVDDIPKALHAAGFSNNAITVLNAKAQGRLSELQSHLTDAAGKPLSALQVENLRRQVRRGAENIRAAIVAASTWKPRSSRSTVFRERVPDGELWQGLWTYAHKYQGEELELLRLVMCEERKNIFTK